MFNVIELVFTRQTVGALWTTEISPAGDRRIVRAMLKTVSWGLAVHRDHENQCISDNFQSEIRIKSIGSSPEIFANPRGTIRLE